PVAYYLFLCIVYRLSLHLLLFSFTHTATTEIYTLSLHDALPISHQRFQNGVLPWGERDRAVSAGDPAGRRVERQIGHSQHRRLGDRKSTRLNSSHGSISYAVFCLKKKKKKNNRQHTYTHHQKHKQ